MLPVICVIVAYLLGSIPTALIFTRRLRGGDIRHQGDGNMGAQNVSHILGNRFGILVGMLDIGKAALAVLLARWLGLSMTWQMIVGVAAILGHDFPVFARFKGGQGTASTMGVYLVFFPLPWLVALTVYGLMYAITHKHTISASVAGGLLMVELIFLRQPWYILVYVLALYLFILVKKAMDSYRIREIRAAQAANVEESQKTHKQGEPR